MAGRPDEHGVQWNHRAAHHQHHAQAQRLSRALRISERHARGPTSLARETSALEKPPSGSFPDGAAYAGHVPRADRLLHRPGRAAVIQRGKNLDWRRGRSQARRLVMVASAGSLAVTLNPARNWPTDEAALVELRYPGRMAMGCFPGA